MAIECASQSSLNSIKEGLYNKFGTKYNIDVAKRGNPRMMVKDVRLWNLTSNEDIVNNIVNLSNFEEFTSNDIKIIKIL